jgi:hypothetical protein
MQNRYIGDIGDFGKYALLKALANGKENEVALSLGVVWYLVPDENHNEDGKHISYLKKTKSNVVDFRDGDPYLYDSLAKIVNEEKRNIKSIKENLILPLNTTYFEKPLSFEGVSNIGKNVKNQRLNIRNNWYIESLKVTETADIIFLDPDNGLENTSVERHHKKGPKYTFYDGLSPFLNRDQSLVIYQHSNRNTTVKQQINDRLKHLKTLFNVEALALTYHRGTSRTFFIIPSQKNNELLCGRLKCFIGKSPWKNHFTLFEKLKPTLTPTPLFQFS